MSKTKKIINKKYNNKYILLKKYVIKYNSK